jgi:hypothetical protein
MARRDEEPARREVPLVRIFLSSPGDVAEERTLARQLIDSELPKLPSLSGDRPGRRGGGAMQLKNLLEKWSLTSLKIKTPFRDELAAEGPGPESGLGTLR